MFIAVKKCTFDRTYEKGDIIPDGVIEPKMVRKLIQCQVINQTADTVPETTEIVETDKKNKRKSKALD